jgi:hypothetical protein
MEEIKMRKPTNKKNIHWFLYFFFVQTKHTPNENRFFPLHEENSRILAICLWGYRKEKEEKGELKDRDWRNWGN